MNKFQKASQVLLAFPSRFHSIHGCYPNEGPNVLITMLIDLIDSSADQGWDDLYVYPEIPLRVGKWSNVNKELSKKRRRPVKIVETGQVFESKKACAIYIKDSLSLTTEWSSISAGITNAVRRSGSAYGYTYVYV